MKSFKTLSQEFKRKQKDERKMGMLFDLKLKTALFLKVDYGTEIHILMLLIFCKLRIHLSRAFSGFHWCNLYFPAQSSAPVEEKMVDSGEDDYDFDTDLM